MQSRVVDRRVGRVILIGPGRKTLLFRGGDPHRPHAGTWWFTPGGGVDPGETTEQAARRELREETGITQFEWGGLVARRVSTFEFKGEIFRNDADLFVAYTETTDIDTSGWMPLEIETVAEYRWMSGLELRQLEEAIYPEELVEALEALCDHLLPAQPWSWG